MKKILAAVDGSKPSLDAARLGLEIARGCKATLTLAYCVVPLMLPQEVPFTVVNDVLKAERARGKQVLAAAVHQLGAPDLLTVELEGAAAERIADLAEIEDFDLVVVGSHGRSAVSRLLMGSLFMGSVAARLIRICKKPVLVGR